MGEKKRPDGGVDSRLISCSRKCGLTGLPALVNASSDILLPFALLYSPPFAGWYPDEPPHVLLFSVPRTDAMADLLTERLILQATIALHSSTHAPRNASTAPTAMKTVPSGYDDFCMKGASAVYGMTNVGMPAPARVGKSVVLVAVPEDETEVLEEASVVVVDVSLVVVASLVVVSVVVAAVVAEVVAVVSLVVVRSGRSVAVDAACASGDAARARMAQASTRLDVRAMV